MHVTVRTEVQQFICSSGQCVVAIHCDQIRLDTLRGYNHGTVPSGTCEASRPQAGM